MNIMYLYGHEVDDDVDFFCIHVEMTSFRVAIVCTKIGFDPIRNTVNISFKYDMSGELLAFPVEDDEAIDAMWEHSKFTQIPSWESALHRK